MKNLFFLVLNDLYFAFKNKGFHLILFIPFFIFVSERFLDKNKIEHGPLRVALLHDSALMSKISSFAKANEKLMTLIEVDTVIQGENLVKEREIDAFLSQNNLIVKQLESPKTLLVTQLFSKLQRTVENLGPDWIGSVQPLQKGHWRKQTLPTWILMLVLLVSLVILPAQVAEEKEKKIVLALLQTPINEFHWVCSKICLGFLLSSISVGILIFCNGMIPINLGLFFIFFTITNFCFSAFGIFLGFLCQNQSSARTLGFAFYLPLLLPSALGDFSKEFTAVANWVPSFPFYKNLPFLLFDENIESFKMWPLIYLLTIGVLSFLLATRLIKSRWLL